MSHFQGQTPRPGGSEKLSPATDQGGEFSSDNTPEKQPIVVPVDKRLETIHQKISEDCLSARFSPLMAIELSHVVPKGQSVFGEDTKEPKNRFTPHNIFEAEAVTSFEFALQAIHAKVYTKEGSLYSPNNSRFTNLRELPEFVSHHFHPAINQSQGCWMSTPDYSTESRVAATLHNFHNFLSEALIIRLPENTALRPLVEESSALEIIQQFRTGQPPQKTARSIIADQVLQKISECQKRVQDLPPVEMKIDFDAKFDLLNSTKPKR